MNIVISGTKEFEDYENFEIEMDEILDDLIANVVRKEAIRLVTSDQGNVDSYTARYANEHDYRLGCWMTRWDEDGKFAGYLRNERMMRDADMLIAFWDSSSKGVQNAILHAKVRGIPVRIIFVEIPTIVDGTKKEDEDA